ncbi:MAG: phospholipid carrier-dependent glycosyltransferase [bacterium]
MKKSKVFLWLILILGFILRIYGISFGFPFFLHPDETKIVEPALTMAFNIKDADFNPHFFYYPHFLMYFLVIVIQCIKVVLIPFGLFNSLSKETFYFIARLCTVIFGTASVYLTYLIGKRVSLKGYEEKIGLLSALFLSTAFLHVRNSHYYTGDVPATFFILLSFLFFLMGIRSQKGRVLFKFILAGFFCGIGISTKYYPALLLILYLPAIFYLFRRDIKKVLLNCFFVGTFALLGFLMFTPYALLDNQKFINTMKESSLRSSSGFMGASSNNPFYYIYNNDLSIDESFSGNSLIESLGLGFIMLALIGILFVLFSVFCNKKRAYNKLLLFVFGTVCLFYAFFARYPVKLVRWLVSIVPLLSILASYGIVKILNGRFLQRVRIPIKILGVVFLGLIIIPNLFSSIRFDYALSRGDTRVNAYNYILENISGKTPIIFESILIHKMVEDGEYVLFQITHDRYNTKGEIDNDLPPNLDTLLVDSKAQYIVINGWARQKYFNPSSYIYFPEVSSAWRDFYNEIDEKFSKVRVFDPEKELLSGPKVLIYSTQ